VQPVQSVRDGGPPATAANRKLAHSHKRF